MKACLIQFNVEAERADVHLRDIMHQFIQNGQRLDDRLSAKCPDAYRM